MSNYHTPVEGSCETEDRKRKLGSSYLEDDQKKAKLGTSLGLSLLQAYDEDELSSEEEEDDWKTSNEETLENVDSTLMKDSNSSAFDFDSSSLMVEEEKEISLDESDVQIDKVEECTIDQISIGKDDEETPTSSQNDKIDSNKLNEFGLEEPEEKSKSVLDETIQKQNSIHIPSAKLDDIFVEETITAEKEKKSESVRPDYNFSVFGKDISSTDSSGSDTKPTKKVKLNRSKFVRPADESSDELKISPEITTTSVTDPVLSITPVTRAKETPPKVDESINDLSSLVVAREIQVESIIKSNDETVQKVDIIQESSDEIQHYSICEESMSSNDVDLSQKNQNVEDDDDDASFSEGQDESVHFITALEENTDNESNDGEPEENLQTTDLVSEMCPSQKDLKPELITEIITDVEQFENGSSNGNINIAMKDTLLNPILIHSIAATAKEMDEPPNIENENVKIVTSMVESDEMNEITSSDEDNKEINITLSEDDLNEDNSSTIDKPEENLQKSEIIIELNDEINIEESTYEELAEPEMKCEDDTEEPSLLVDVANQLTIEQDLVTCSEERFKGTRNVVEPIEIIYDEVIEETSENIPVAHVEILKLEEALTGQSETSQPYVKKLTGQVPARKGRPPKVKLPTIEDGKQNIKLHISLQGDRASILNNTQATMLETSSLAPIRVKRQYRKRLKVPAELEAQQASAKEYTHRLRQRTKRETPGAKKRTRKKKNQEPSLLGSKIDPASNSSSTDGSEKVMSSLTDGSEKVMPLTVAINKLPSRKRNNAEIVQPIKLKIRKNANVTLECTSKYDVCLAREEDNGIERAINVLNAEIDSMLDEACKKEEPSSSAVKKTSSPWSHPELQRMEHLLKEANITITPVTSGRDVPPSSTTSILKPILNLPEKFKLQTTSVADIAPPLTTLIKPVCESDETSKNLIISLKADADERNSPWKIVKSPRSEAVSSSPAPINIALSKQPVDVKSEIRKKIALVEKQKQDVTSTLEMQPNYESEPLIETHTINISSSSESETMQEDSESDRSMQQADIISHLTQSMVFDLSPVSSAPTIPKTPSSAMTTHTKLPRLPIDLFPKKRGRPTKAMVAAREAYWQQQDEMEKSKRGDETEGPAVDAYVSTMTPESVKIVKKGRKMKRESFEKKDSDDLSYEELPYDPDREAEKQKRVQEERIRKEEERERKNELRRLRAKERSDVIKAKRLRQKMKAKERHKMAKELRRLQQEEKKKLEEQLKRLPASMGFDDETRMSAENSQAANISFSAGLIDDDSSGATNDLSQKLKKSRMEVTDPDSKDLMVDQIAEYQWPIQGGDLYMIQEQVSNFLGVKSFKRKYPDIWRRPVDSEERAYLVDSGLVSETLCNLGITAVRSSEVLDIMCSDFPEKYEEFRRYMREKQMKELSFKQRAWANGLGYKLLMADGSKQDMKKRAMESVSNWNSALNKSRVDDRRCHMDLQTFLIHYPKQRGVKMTPPSLKVGSYPVTILPGQFCDFYKDYTPTELRYLPVNTVLYGPLKHPSFAQNDYASLTDSDDSSSSDDSSTTSEDTQATEETLEDLDTSMVLDGNNLNIEFKDLSPVPDEEQTLKEINGDCDPLTENDASKVLCKICLGDEFRNKMNVPEVLISCSQCASANHPTCLDLSLNIVPRIKSYAWQCPDCKICAQCKENADEDKMLFCDTCDQGYHIYCVGLIKVPAGNWQCKECSRLKEHNGSVVDIDDVKKEYIPVKKEAEIHLVEVTN